MKPAYPRSAVEPIAVERIDANSISLRYKVAPESMFYSKGVDYAASGDTLRVYIRRCEIRKECSPMAETRIPLGEDWSAEVVLPYAGQKVVVVHSDGEQPVYPVN